MQNASESIYSWVKSYPQHVLDYNFNLDTDDRLYVINEVTARPDRIIDYEDPTSKTMIGPRVTNGCNYVFKRGLYYRSPCERETVEGKDKCAFHNHCIFDMGVLEHGIRSCYEIPSYPKDKVKMTVKISLNDPWIPEFNELAKKNLCSQLGIDVKELTF